MSDGVVVIYMYSAINLVHAQTVCTRLSFPSPESEPGFEVRGYCNVFLSLPASLMTQPPKTHTKKGSGNIVYNELSQTLECGATNQIAPFAIDVQSAQFIMKIIFTKNAARMCHNVVAFMSRTCQKGSKATLSEQKASSQSSDHLSMILERYCAICCLQRTNEGYRSLP